MNTKIKNLNQLAIKSFLRKKILFALEEGLKAIDTTSFIRKQIFLEDNILKIKKLSFSLNKNSKVYIVAIGKNSLEAGLELERILRKKIKGGIIFTPRLSASKNNQSKAVTKKTSLQIIWGDHPFPTKNNVVGSLKLKQFLSTLDKNSFVIFVISGGGSTLLSLHPREEEGLKKERKMFYQMFKKGASIEEINIVRKHFSLLRGGGLARLLYPIKGVALIFSDVPGDDLAVISSSPTVLDKSTVEDAWKVIKRYNLQKVVKKDDLLETVKDRKYFSSITNILFLNNRVFLEEARGKLRKMGINAFIKNVKLEGEARSVGQFLWKEGLKMKSNSAFLYGGETTVRVKGKGKGGRNEELVLSILNCMKKEKKRDNNNLVFAALATDGRDNTEFAGALADILTLRRAEKLKLDPVKFLAKNDSFSFFKKVGDYILTGPTGSNVSDVIIVLKGK